MMVPPVAKRTVKPNGKCAVCKHPERVRIEMLRSQGAAVRALARKFGLKNHYVVHSHWTHHVSDERKASLALGPVTRQALAARVAEESESVIDHYRAVRAGLYTLYDAAVTAGDRLGGSMLAGRIHENLAAMARLTGQLASSPLVQINQQNIFVNDPEFAQFQARLIAILARHPAALDEVVVEFESLERSHLPDAQKLPALEHNRAA
jgi:hypothetical protein